MKLYVLSEREVIDWEGESSTVVAAFDKFSKAREFAASKGFTEYKRKGHYGVEPEFVPAGDKKYSDQYDGRSYVLAVVELNKTS